MSEEKKNEQLEMMRTMAELAKERTKMAKKRTEMSAKRSKMSSDRSEMSAQRTYMNTERTLSVWIRTSLATMIFGIAIDRFGLMFPKGKDAEIDLFIVQNVPSTITGAILVFFSMVMAIYAAYRFFNFTQVYKKEHSFPLHHKPLLPVVYAIMIVIFGAVLLFLMLGIV